MPRKLTITLEEAVYEGLYRTVGKRPSASSLKTWCGRM